MCTCPKTLSLDPADNKTCIGSLTGEKGSEATTLSPVTISLLPTDCLWSEWSDWTACPAGCGSGFRTRSRKVAIPARNGGSCKGESEEKYACTTTDCNVVPPASTERTSISDQDIPRAFSLEDQATTQYLQETTTQTPSAEEISEKAVQIKIEEGKAGSVSESTTKLAEEETVKTGIEGRTEEQTTLAPETSEQKAVTEQEGKKEPGEPSVKTEESATNVPEREQVTTVTEVEARTDKVGAKSEESTTQASVVTVITGIKQEPEFGTKTDKDETTLRITPEVEGKSEESTRRADLDIIIPITEQEAREGEKEITTQAPIETHTESRTEHETLTETEKHAGEVTSKSADGSIEATTQKTKTEETETVTAIEARTDKGETTTVTSKSAQGVEGKSAESTTRPGDLEIIVPVTEEEAGEGDITTQIPNGNLTESRKETEMTTLKSDDGSIISKPQIEARVEEKETTTQTVLTEKVEGKTQIEEFTTLKALVYEAESATEYEAQKDKAETTTLKTGAIPEGEIKSNESTTRQTELEIIVPVTEQEAREGEKETTTQFPKSNVVQPEPELGAKSDKDETTIRITPKGEESTTGHIDLEIIIPVTEQETREGEKEITTQIPEVTVGTRIQKEPELASKTEKDQTTVRITTTVEGKSEESTTRQADLEIIIPVTEQEAREGEIEVTTQAPGESQNETKIPSTSEKEINVESTTLKAEVLSEIEPEAKKVTEETTTQEFKEPTSEITTQIPAQTSGLGFEAIQPTIKSATPEEIELTTVIPGTIIEIVPGQEPEARKEPEESTSIKEEPEETTTKASSGGFLLPVTESEARQEETTIKAEAKMGATETVLELTTQIPSGEETITEQEARKDIDESTAEKDRTQITTQAPEGGMNLPVTEQAEGGINLPVTEQAARKEEGELNTTFKTEEGQAGETTTTGTKIIIIPVTEIESSSKGAVEIESRTEQTSSDQKEKAEATTIKEEVSEGETEAAVGRIEELTTETSAAATSEQSITDSVQEKSKETEE